MRIDDEYIDYSLSQKDTLIHQRVAVAPRPEMPMGPRAPKKTRLERLPLSETTSAVMRVIRRARVERLPEYFEQTCDRRQHETAVICGSSRLTYQELDHRANRLAHLLISRGVAKGNPVGILLERSLDTYIALLGVLKAGAAFVPLDPLFPSDLVAFIVEDAGLRGLVTTSAFREKTSALSCPVLELDQEHEALSVQDETRPQVCVDPVSLCYIIYTFDTTGRPKGVAVSHANIVNFLRVVTPIYRVTRNDRVYQGMSIAFDFSFEEIWPTWIAGATLVAGPTDSQRLGHGLTEFLVEHKITVLCCVPTLLATIERDVPSLRSLLLGGEVCPADLVSRWSRPGRRMLNTYGPPETTLTATWCELFPGRPVTIGSPLPTYHIYILDDQLRLVEDGESGEICIGGPGVAIGYLNRPDLTKDRFVPNPVWRDREIVSRLYRTGDFGRVTPSGEIEYLGRIDTQVKIRGYGIGRGKVEQAALPWANLAPLNEYASTLPFETRAISELEAETSKLRIVNQTYFKNVYKHVMTDPLYRNSLFNMASTFILGGLGFVFWIIIARLYKTENIGIATTLISIMTLLSSLTIMGLNVSLNRYLPKFANKNELINSSFVIVTLVSLLASVIFLLGLQIFSPQLVFLQSNLFYIISFTLFVIFCSWNYLIDNIFMAFRAAGNILIKNSIISTLKLVLPFALIALGAYGIFASVASAFALGVLVSLMILLLHFKIRPSISVNVSWIKETSVYSFANYIADFMLIMPSLVLPVIILNVLSAKYAAYYYIASMIQSTLLVIPLATTQALLTEGSYNEAELKKHVKKALAMILVILLPTTAIIVFGGNIILQLFGKTYATEAFQFLQLYSISTIFTALLLIANAIMKVKHQMKSLVILNVVATVFTLWLSYAFISGRLVGIGWGLILGQAIAGFISIYFIVRNYSGTSESRASPSKVQGVLE
jgi:amino acid adenylation domain-containing protein